MLSIILKKAIRDIPTKNVNLGKVVGKLYFWKLISSFPGSTSIQSPGEKNVLHFDSGQEIVSRIDTAYVAKQESIHDHWHSGSSQNDSLLKSVTI